MSPARKHIRVTDLVVQKAGNSICSVDSVVIEERKKLRNDYYLHVITKYYDDYFIIYYRLCIIHYYI